MTLFSCIFIIVYRYTNTFATELHSPFISICHFMDNMVVPLALEFNFFFCCKQPKPALFEYKSTWEVDVKGLSLFEVLDTFKWKKTHKSSIGNTEKEIEKREGTWVGGRVWKETWRGSNRTVKIEPKWYSKAQRKRQSLRQRGTSPSIIVN